MNAEVPRSEKQDNGVPQDEAPREQAGAQSTRDGQTFHALKASSDRQREAAEPEAPYADKKQAASDKGLLASLQ